MKHQLATKEMTTDREFENLQQYLVAVPMSHSNQVKFVLGKNLIRVYN